MKYLGEYTLKIENGKVKFPWPDSKNKIWIEEECTVDEETITNYLIIDSEEIEKYITDEEAAKQDFKIKNQGDFVVDSDEMWEVPEIILKHLETDDIIFMGISSKIRVMSVADMEKHQLILEELEKILKKIAIEKGYYDEHTN